MENLLTKLHHFSSTDNPYFSFWVKEKDLFKELKKEQQRLNFPAVSDDVGILLAFLSSTLKPTNIFEMGSGYGGSAFWFLSGYAHIKKIVLTEKRTDLLAVFHELPWPLSWKEKIHYHQEDAFLCLEKTNDEIDLALVDGVKADYLSFLEKLHPKLSDKAFVVVDNTFWKGKILDPKELQKKSAASVLKMHQELAESKLYAPCFIPMSDGITLLQKLS